MNGIRALALGAMSLLAASAAMASDGTVTINGKVTDASCKVTINGVAQSTIITMPTVSTQSLAKFNQTSGATPMYLELSECPTTGGVRAYFETLNVDQGNGRLMNMAASPAEGVSVDVFNKVSGLPIDLRQGGVGTGNAYVTLSAQGTAELPYAVRYVNSGFAITAGDVQSQLVYSLQYQ